MELLKPYVSKDCDVLGDKNVLAALSLRTRLKMKQYSFGQASVSIGYLYDPNDSDKTPLIEVLKGVHGLRIDELQDSVPINFSDKLYRTLNPVQLLKAKVANAVDLPQGNRQDVRHVQILIPCVRAYIHYFMSTVTEDDKAAGRRLVNLLANTLEIIKSSKSSLMAAKYGFDFYGCFPLQELRTYRHTAVQNFCKYQLHL